MTLPNKLIFLLQVISLTFLALTEPSSAKAGGDEQEVAGSCPEAWDEYVEMVSEIAAPLGGNFPLIFEKRGGGIFDCLSRLHNERQFTLANEFSLNSGYNVVPELSIGRLIPSDPSSWPGSVCNCVEYRSGGVQFYYLNLPLDPEILETLACRERIRRTVMRLVEEHKNDRN